MHVFRSMRVAASYKLATEISVWGVHAVGNFISDNNDAKEKRHLRAVLCKNQTKWEMKNFEPPTQIYMEVGPHEGNHWGHNSTVAMVTPNVS